MTEEYLKANGLGKVNEYNIHKEVKLKYCKKCMTPLLDGGTSDGFCNRGCRVEWFKEQRKLNEEVYRGARYGE